MAFTAWGFIYLATEGADPEVDRAVLTTGGLTTTVVALGDKAQLGTAARRLADEEAQSIELCGAFTAADVVAAREATENRVPIGAVRYDMDAVPQLADLFA